MHCDPACCNPASSNNGRGGAWGRSGHHHGLTVKPPMRHKPSMRHVEGRKYQGTLVGILNARFGKRILVCEHKKSQRTASLHNHSDRHPVSYRASIIIYIWFWQVSGRNWPRDPLQRIGLQRWGRTQNKPRRPILKPFGDHFMARTHNEIRHVEGARQKRVSREHAARLSNVY